MSRFAATTSAALASLALLAAAGSLRAQPAPAQAAPAAITASGIRGLVGKSKGKVLLVNFWATWCPPCVREFPALVKLHQAYGSRGLEVVGISMNDAAEMGDVREFLGRHKPPFPVYVAGTVDDAFYPAIDERWQTELPLTLIYDSAGTLRFYHNGERSEAQFEKDVQSLLDPGSKQ